MTQPTLAEIRNWLILTRARIAIAHQPANLRRLMRPANDRGEGRVA